MKLIKPLEIGSVDNIRRVSAAYYRNDLGRLIRVGPNIARFRYDENGNFLGILTEPNPYQSVISNSDVFTDATTWENSGVTVVGTTDGPDGDSDSAYHVEGPGTLTVVDRNAQDTTFRMDVASAIRTFKFEVLPQGTDTPFVNAIGPQRARTSGSMTSTEVPWPEAQVGDLGILLLKVTGSAFSPVSSDWTEVLGEGAVNPNNPYRMYWKRADLIGAQIPAQVTNRGSILARIFTIRGASASGDPIGFRQRDIDDTVTTNKSVEGFASTNDRALVVLATAYFARSATNFTRDWQNFSLTDLTVNLDGTGTTNFAGGGGFIVASGRFVVGGTIVGGSKVRSSIFVRPRDGEGIVRLRNAIDASFEEFDLNSQTASGNGTFELYQEGWWRISSEGNTPYTFQLELTDGEFDIFRANLVGTADYYQPLLNRDPMTGDVTLPFTTSQLVYSNIPEPDPDYLPEANATIWAEGTYAEGDTVIFEHGLFEALRETDDRPDIGAAKTDQDDPQSWTRLGTSNHWKMYDMLRGVEFKSQSDRVIDQIVFLPKVATAYALFGIGASNLRVQASREGELLYDKEYNLVDLTNNAYWYEFWTNTPVRRPTVVAFDLPPVPGLLVRFTLTSEGPVELGKLIVGEVATLGCTRWNVKTEYVNTSRQEREFGNLVLVPRRVYKIRDYEIRFNTEMAEKNEQVIESIINGPTVFVGSEKYSTTTIYGIVKDFRPVLVGPRESMSTLKVESI